MRPTKSIVGVLEALGIPAEGRGVEWAGTVGLSLAFPIEHLMKHDFPPGCSQLYSRVVSALVAAQHSGVRITPGPGGFHLRAAWQTDGGGVGTVIFSRPNDDLLAEATAVEMGVGGCPENNGTSTKIFDVHVTIASLGTQSASKRAQLDGGMWIVPTSVTPWEGGWVIPSGHSLYILNTTAAGAITLNLKGWESCG